jgi:hypothetical protein
MGYLSSWHSAGVLYCTYVLVVVYRIHSSCVIADTAAQPKDFSSERYPLILTNDMFIEYSKQNIGNTYFQVRFISTNKDFH